MTMCAPRCVFLALVVHGASGFPWPGFLFYPKDPEVGDVSPASDEELVQRLDGKAALVVGGTDGIGRGTAINLAKLGASVTVVGHSPSKANWTVGNMSAIARDPQKQSFNAYAVDLETVKGCQSFLQQLLAKGTHFDYFVLTVGTWPDRKNPRTPDGLDKVLALDVLARWFVTKEALPLLKSGGRVLSVLGSTMKVPPLPPVSTMQEITNGSKSSYSLSEMLGTAGAEGDTWMQTIAQQRSGINLIGTWPGVVASDVARPYFPPWLYPIVHAAEGLIAISPEQAGKMHVQILTSPNAGKKPVSYFNAAMSGRLTTPLASDQRFAEWLEQFLSDFVKTHGGGGASSSVIV